MFLVEMHYKIAAAVHHRHKCHRLAGIEVLISIIGHRAAVSSTFKELVNAVLHNLSRQLKYTSMLKSLEELMGSIIFCLVASGVSFALAEGNEWINAPKVVECLGSYGRKYGLLTKSGMMICDKMLMGSLWIICCCIVLWLERLWNNFLVQLTPFTEPSGYMEKKDWECVQTRNLLLSYITGHG
nr:serine/threonine-protein kinase atm [Quercus suber]